MTLDHDHHPISSGDWHEALDRILALEFALTKIAEAAEKIPANEQYLSHFFQAISDAVKRQQ